MADRTEIAAELARAETRLAELDAERSDRLGALVSGLLREGSQVFATVPRDGEMPDAVKALPKWRIADGVMSPA